MQNRQNAKERIIKMEQNKMNGTEAVVPETPVQVVCRKCGASLQEGQDFCPKCGQKVDFGGDAEASVSANSFSAAVSKVSEAIKKMPKIKLIAVLAAVVLVVVGIAVAPTLFTSVEDLCAQGNYKEAYIKASGEEKLAVAAENAIAVLSEESIDMLKDPSSFVLRDGYASISSSDNELYQRAVLFISGKNSYGNYVENIWYYAYNQDEDYWEYKNTYYTLDVEDSDTLGDLAAKSMISNMVAGTWGVKLSKEQVKRINTMFKDDTLHKVTLIDSKTIFSLLPEK